MDREEIVNAVRSAARTVSDTRKLEFVHAEVSGTKRNMIVRIFVDKDGGVSLDDCGAASRAIEEILDADDIIPVAYVLEVSSPGLERELYSLDDFRKFVGKTVRIKTSADFAGKKQFKGTLEGVDGETVTVSDRQAGTIELPYASVTKANLVFDLAEELKKKK
ncbi:ribosome maturation factor RimP [soil metagenome]